MKFCPQCGAELKPEAKFCAACGTPIQVQTPPPPAPQPTYQPQEPVYEQAREATNAFTDAISGKTNLIQRVINIITKPKQEWLVVNIEQPNTMKLIGGYALILILIPTIVSFVSIGFIGESYGGFMVKSISGGIMQALVQLISGLVGIYLLAMVIDLLAPSFDSEKNMGRSLQLAVYSNTPSWVAGILLFIPGFKWIVFIIGLYSIYLMYTGMGVIKKTPDEKRIGYVAVSIIAMILIMVLLAVILTAIMGLFFASRMGFGM